MKLTQVPIFEYLNNRLRVQTSFKIIEKGKVVYKAHDIRMSYVVKMS